MLDRRCKSRHLLTQRRACCPGLPRGPEQAPAPWPPPSAACAPRIVLFSLARFDKIDLPPAMLDRRCKSRHLLTQRRACCPGLPRGPEQAPAPWSPPSAACALLIILALFFGGCCKFEKIDLPPTMLDRRFKSRHLLTQRRACCPGLPRGPEQATAP